MKKADELIHQAREQYKVLLEKFPNAMYAHAATFYMDDSDDFTISTVTGINESSGGIVSIVYPNPMTERSTISFKNDENNSLHIVLININGQTVFKSNSTTTDQIVIERNGLPSGLYYFQIILENKTQGTGKIVIN